jgi:hypothetical protein
MELIIDSKYRYCQGLEKFHACQQSGKYLTCQLNIAGTLGTPRLASKKKEALSAKN